MRGSAEQSALRTFIFRSMPSAGHVGWLIFPISLLFFTLQLAWGVFSLELPLLALGGFFLSLFYRTKGLILSYLFLLYEGVSIGRGHLPKEVLWEMGLLYTFAVTFFITLLVIEMMEERERMAREKSEENARELADLQAHCLELEEKYNGYIESLKDTIQELIREAEQRRIDRVAVLERCHALQNEVERLQEGSVEELRRQHEQLRMQFEEKKLVLQKTREELFEMETAYLAYQREVSLFDNRELEPLLLQLLEEQKMLEEEIALLESLIT